MEEKKENGIIDGKIIVYEEKNINWR